MERSIKELLILLRDNAKVNYSWFGLKQRIREGLCSEVNRLMKKDIITYKEWQNITYFINTRRPCSKYTGYGWKPKLWRSRKRWLNRHIKSL